MTIGHNQHHCSYIEFEQPTQSKSKHSELSSFRIVAKFLLFVFHDCIVIFIVVVYYPYYLFMLYSEWHQAYHFHRLLLLCAMIAFCIFVCIFLSVQFSYSKLFPSSHLTLLVVFFANNLKNISFRKVKIRRIGFFFKMSVTLYINKIFKQNICKKRIYVKDLLLIFQNIETEIKNLV